MASAEVLAQAMAAAVGQNAVDFSDADITSYPAGKRWCAEKGVVRARAAMGADTPLKSHSHS
eukprot:COSAG02_NODE_60094_length_272_cov_0.630058_1_plen_62_part_01